MLLRPCVGAYALSSFFWIYSKGVFTDAFRRFFRTPSERHNSQTHSIINCNTTSISSQCLVPLFVFLCFILRHPSWLLFCMYFAIARVFARRATIQRFCTQGFPHGGISFLKQSGKMQQGFAGMTLPALGVLCRDNRGAHLAFCYVILCKRYTFCKHMSYYVILCKHKSPER